MPAQRTPLAKARLTGADKKNPQRFRTRQEPALSGRPIGDAPPYLTGHAARAWAAFAVELPWLVHEDRPALELAATLRGRVAVEGMATTPAMFGAYRMALGSLGATPADRGRLATAMPEDADDPFAAFERSR